MKNKKNIGYISIPILIIIGLFLTISNSYLFYNNTKQVNDLKVVNSEKEKIIDNNINQNIKSTFINEDTENIADFIGYYKKTTGVYGEENTGPFDCDTFVITSGDSRIIDYFKKQFYEGNTVNHVSSSNNLQINLELNNLSVNDKNKIFSSTKLKPITLSLKKKIEWGKGAPACYSPFELLSIKVVDTSNWKTYRNEEYGFEFKYPPINSTDYIKDLYIEKKDKLGSWLFYAEVGSDDDGPHFAAGYLMIDKVTINDYLNSLDKDRYRIIENTKERINNIDWTIITTEDKEMNTIDIGAITEHNGFTFHTSADGIPNNPIVSTFKFIKPTVEKQSQLLKTCPDEWIENQMPGNPEVETLNPQYYILKGVRREMEEFDVDWVTKNCKLNKKIVY